CGDGDFAFDIADRALNMWREETDFSYSTFECFGIKTRRGGWFHNFGGLSAPVCIWADAYYRPGSVNTGFDVWTDKRENDGEKAEITFKYYGGSEQYTILAVMNGGKNYTVTLDGEKLDFTMRTSGAVEITLPGTVREGTIKIVSE
ncbi:MAG: hypothetical protein IK063_06815, partial [Clostridia bacterium]|nr:hypothetical protein [Clostridia bacterium]